MLAGNRSVVLTGFMGTGKSTIGRLLADRLDFEWVDSDRLIENRYGPIPDIFEYQGEDHFRRYELEIAAELAQQERLVISTGGRMMLDRKVQAILVPATRVFCLVASPTSILDRVGGERAAALRPVLAGPDPGQRIVELLAERASGYAEFEQIETDGKRPSEIVTEIAQLVATESGPIE